MQTLRRRRFWLVFGVPNILALIYFLFIASPIYISTSSFTVYKQNAQSQNISAVISGLAGGDSSQGAFIVQAFIEGYDEYKAVFRKVDIANHYGRGDILGGYGGAATLFEKNDVALWHYYQSHVQAKVDEHGIAELSVQGYSPDVAKSIADIVLRDAIKHVELMDQQQTFDFHQNIEKSQSYIHDQIKSDELALSEYRVKTGIQDPSELYRSKLNLLNSLSEQKAQISSQIAAIATGAPKNPVVQNLNASLTAVQAKAIAIEAEITHLSKVSATYNQLVQARDNHVDLMRQTETAAQQNRLASVKNKYYLNIISAPSEPQAPELPNRLEWLAGIFVITTILWGVLR